MSTASQTRRTDGQTDGQMDTSRPAACGTGRRSLPPENRGTRTETTAILGTGTSSAHSRESPRAGPSQKEGYVRVYRRICACISVLTELPGGLVAMPSRRALGG